MCRSEVAAPPFALHAAQAKMANDLIVLAHCLDVYLPPSEWHIHEHLHPCEGLLHVIMLRERNDSKCPPLVCLIGVWTSLKEALKLPKALHDTNVIIQFCNETNKYLNLEMSCDIVKTSQSRFVFNPNRYVCLPVAPKPHFSPEFNTCKLSVAPHSPEAHGCKFNIVEPLERAVTQSSCKPREQGQGLFKGFRVVSWPEYSKNHL